MTITPTQSSINISAKYRGAVIEDLQLPPATSLALSSSVFDVLQLAYEREFDQIPVLSDPKSGGKPRRPLGYVDAKELKRRFEEGKADGGETIKKHYYRFATSSSSPGSSPSSSPAQEYSVLTPLTPLAELQGFFERTDAAFGLVTDENRKFVYAVVTKDDLNKFVSRRAGQAPLEPEMEQVVQRPFTS